MRGKVKWFSKEKGYGFIFGDDEKDYYFNVKDLKGGELPEIGDIVDFKPAETKKGLRALEVEITSKSSKKETDDRVVCPHCGKKMIPRIITYRGSLEKSVCPFCGGTYQEFSKCFIATAVYGSPEAEEVILFRRFRDQVLQKHSSGRLFIRIYYKISPYVADFLKEQPVMAGMVKKVLDQLAKILKKYEKEKGL